MFKKYFSFFLAVVFFCTTSGGVVLAKEKTGGKLSQAEKIKKKVVEGGTGVKARARVKLADGSKLQGYISEFAADDFTLVRTDEQIGSPVRVNYRDVAEFKALGKGLSTTSKVVIGTGIALGALVIVAVVAIRDIRRIGR